MFRHTSRLQVESKPDKHDGRHEFGHLAGREPPGDAASVPAPEPKLYATCNGAMGKPSGPALGTETGLAGKIKDAFS